MHANILTCNIQAEFSIGTVPVAQTKELPKRSKTKLNTILKSQDIYFLNNFLV